MILLSAILHLFLVTILGAVLIHLFDRHNNTGIWMRCALGYGLGTGIVCQIMIWFVHFGVRYNSINISLIVLILLCTSLCIQRRLPLEPEKVLPNQAASAETMFWVYGWSIVGLSVVCSFLLALLKPIMGWDAVSAIGFVAKVIFYDGSLENISRFPHSYYPLHVPLLESWLALGAGVFDGQSVKIIFPLYYVSLIVVAYRFFKSYTTAQWALFGVLLIVAANFVFFHSVISYRDFTLMYYNFCTVALLLLWMKNESFVFLILAAVFAGITSLVKMEGSLFLPIYTLAVLIIVFLQRRSGGAAIFMKIAGFCTVAYGMFMVFHTYRIKMGLTTGEKTKLIISAESFGRILDIFHTLYSNLFTSANWSIVWLILILSLFRWRQSVHKKYAAMALLLLCLFFALVIAYGAFTSSYPWIGGKYQHLTLSRVILHFFPLSAIVIVFLNAPAKKPMD